MLTCTPYTATTLPIPIRLVEPAVLAALPSTAVKVYLALLCYTDPAHPAATATGETLAGHAGVSIRRVWACLRTLESAGLLHRKREGRPNTYHLGPAPTVPEMAQSNEVKLPHAPKMAQSTPISTAPEMTQSTAPTPAAPPKTRVHPATRPWMAQLLTPTLDAQLARLLQQVTIPPSAEDL